MCATVKPKSQAPTNGEATVAAKAVSAGGKSSSQKVGLNVVILETREIF